MYTSVKHCRARTHHLVMKTNVQMCNAFGQVGATQGHSISKQQYVQDVDGVNVHFNGEVLGVNSFIATALGARGHRGWRGCQGTGRRLNDSRVVR